MSETAVARHAAYLESLISSGDLIILGGPGSGIRGHHPDASKIAAEAHAGQLDKEGKPYVEHLSRVADSVSDGAKQIAWLHDALEDTHETRESLLAKGVPAADLDSVHVLTRQPGETYSEFISRIAHSGDARAIEVKLADLKDNLRPGQPSLRRRYEKAIAQLTAVRHAGGAGSGNFSHAGRPGEIGGSAPSSVKKVTLSNLDLSPKEMLDTLNTVFDSKDDLDGAKFEAEKIAKAFVRGVDEPFDVEVVPGGTPNALEFHYDGETGTEVSWVLQRNPFKELSADLSYMKVEVQKAGEAKAILRSSVDELKRLGVKSVELDADIDVGKYAWARFGFVPALPSEAQWIYGRVAKTLAQEHESPQLAAELKAEAAKPKPNPEMIWKIADHPDGFRLLAGPDSKRWSGKLELSNARQMERFNAYVAATAGTKRPKVRAAVNTRSVGQASGEERKGVLFYVDDSGIKRDASLWAEILDESELLRGNARSAGEAAGHPFHGNQWTLASTSEGAKGETAREAARAMQISVKRVFQGSLPDDIQTFKATPGLEPFVPILIKQVAGDLRDSATKAEKRYSPSGVEGQYDEVLSMASSFRRIADSLEKEKSVEALYHVRNVLLKTLGGKGSGNFGHKGRPGEAGGSTSDPVERIPAGPEAYCFSNASSFAASRSAEDPTIVHGTVDSVDGRRIAHAWVEIGDKVYDPTAGISTSKKRYTHEVNATTDARYSVMQAQINMIRTGNHGPWTAAEVGPRHLAAGRSPLHAAADRHIPQIRAVVDAAMKKGKAGIDTSLLQKAISTDNHQLAEKAVSDVSTAFRAALLKTLPSVLHSTFLSGGDVGAKVVPTKIRAAAAKQSADVFEFDPEDEAVQTWIEDHAAELADQLAGTTEEDISDALDDAFSSGELDGLEETIVGIAEDADRSAMIAANEAMTVLHEGQRTAWQQATDEGYLKGNEVRQWNAEETACPECIDLDGETAEMDGDYPGGIYSPPLHPHCNCSEILVSAAEARAAGGVGSGIKGHTTPHGARTSVHSAGGTVESWYDRQSRSWVTQRKDDAGHLLGDAEYNGTKAGMNISHSEMLKTGHRSAGEAVGHPFHGNQWTEGTVLGKDGTPLLVHHGSVAKGMTVDTLDPSAPRIRKATTPTGIAFTTDKRSAYGYARTPGPRSKGGGSFGSVVSANLIMRNPLDVTSDVKSGQKKGLSFGDAKREALKKLTAEHDGMIFRGDGLNNDEYVVFSKDQIRAPHAPRTAGGKGSGNFGHSGRPGEVGGSTSEGSSEWFASLEKVGGPKGSNSGGVFKDPHGSVWYVKDYANPEQAFSEQISNAIYRKVGAAVPSSVVSPDGKQFASRWIEGSTKTLAASGVTKETANRVLDHFAADVLTANWDAVGLVHDNVLVKPDGSVVRVDQGGTLLFRAQGGLKPEAGLSKIGEWETLAQLNPAYAKIFHKAGVASGDALGERAVKQIDDIVNARPAGGWKTLVDQAAPHASSAFKSKVSQMLEARQAGLEAKRHELHTRSVTQGTARSAGGVGSGILGHTTPHERAERAHAIAVRKHEEAVRKRGEAREVPTEVSTVKEAIPLILAGKVVELKNVHKVNTLLTKLAAIAKDAEKKGKAAPNYDACKITVAGSSVFCGQAVKTKEYPNGMPRIIMPQFGGVPRKGSPADKLPKDDEGRVDVGPEFLDHLERIGIDSKSENVTASHLMASQAELVGPVIAKRVAKREYESKSPIFVSRDNYIIDGHHRWASIVGRDFADKHVGDLKIRVVRVDAPISEVLKIAQKWTKSYGMPGASGSRAAGMHFESLSSVWKEAKDALTKTFTFPNRRSLADFLSRLFADANVVNHHPDVATKGDGVLVKYTTHDAGDTVTEADHVCTDRVDALADATPDIPVPASGLHTLGGPGSGIKGHHTDRPVSLKFSFGRSTYAAIQKMFSPSRDWIDDPNPEEQALARARVKFLDSMYIPGKWHGKAKVDLTPKEIDILAEEFEHLGSTPALLPEFEKNVPNQQIRLAFTNIAQKLRAVKGPTTLGGPGSGNFGHSGRPGEIGGSSSGGSSSDPLAGETPGLHTKEAAYRLAAYLERETGMQFELHGSLSKSDTPSPNDIDLRIVDPTAKMTEAELEAYHAKMDEEIHRAESEGQDRVDRGEITEDQLMQELFGDSPKPDPLEAALAKIGFQPTRQMGWMGVGVTRFHNPTTGHTVEIWGSSGDQGSAESGPPRMFARDLGGKGSGNFHYAGRPGTVGGSSSSSDGRSAGTPKEISSEDFVAKYPFEDQIFRGVTNAPAAAGTRQGILGDGDFGRGLYFSRAIGHAQSYSQATMGATGGFIIRGVIAPGAKVKAPPKGVEGSVAIDKWAARNKIDVVDSDNYQIVRNPAVLILDKRNYTGRETVVLEHRARGWKIPEGYEDIKVLGGPGSGNFEHEGIPGHVGGSKPKNAPATKEQIAKVWELNQQGHSHKKVAEATGLHPNTIAHIVIKVKKQKAAISQTLLMNAKVDKLPATKPKVEQNEIALEKIAYDKYKAIADNPSTTAAEKAAALQQYEKDSPYDFYGKPKTGKPFEKQPSYDELFAKEDATKADVTKASKAEVEQKLQEEKDKQASSLTKSTNGFVPDPSGNLTKLVPGGMPQVYSWKEKTTGPQKGKYAYFQNGIQVSSPFAKEDFSKAIGTIHQGQGPMDIKAKPAPPVYDPDAPHIWEKTSPIKKGALSTLGDWPISNGMERQMGSAYPKQLEQIGSSWATTLTAKETNAVKSYTGNGYSSLNTALRSEEPLSVHQQNTAKLLSSAIDKAPAPPPPELVWRQITGDNAQKFAQKLAKGDVVKLAGFQSTTINPNFVHFSQTVFEIKPKQGAYVRPISHHKGEYEYLIQHHAEFAVHGMAEVTLGGKKMKVIQLEQQ